MFTDLKNYIAIVATLAVLVMSGSVAAGRLATQKKDDGNARPSDRLVALAVENELLSSDAVDGNQIDVKVEKGLVTLSGRVTNLLAKDVAKDLALRIQGVLVVSNQIVVVPTKRKDADIAKDVKTAFRNDAVMESKEVTVMVKRGKVTLTGGVDSFAEKWLAEDTASGVAGVVGIENDLKVTLSEKRSESEIREEVQGLLDSTVHLDDAKIDVTVKDQTVVLNGVVGSGYAKNFARKTAYVAGVQKVDDRGLRIQSDGGNVRRQKRYADVNDKTINMALRLALRNDPRVMSFDPKVEVKDGVVTLSGNVRFLRAKQAAKSIALATIGVRRVRDHLKVRWADEGPTDKQIAEFVLQALRRDPYVQHLAVRVRVRDAHVSLYGIADSKFEKMHASWTASGQKGVVHVNNYLTARTKWVPKSDKEIQETLEEKLKFAFFNKAKKIDVTVKDGVAILRGTVDNWMAWQVAMDKALEAGARRPHNLLKVRYGRAYSALRYAGPRMYIPR